MASEDTVNVEHPRQDLASGLKYRFEGRWRGADILAKMEGRGEEEDQTFNNGGSSEDGGPRWETTELRTVS